MNSNDKETRWQTLKLFFDELSKFIGSNEYAFIYMGNNCYIEKLEIDNTLQKIFIYVKNYKGTCSVLVLFDNNELEKQNVNNIIKIINTDLVIYKKVNILKLLDNLYKRYDVE